MKINILAGIMKTSLSQLSMEADVQNGRAFSEHEHEFYVRFPNLDFLQNAMTMDLQEQWTIKIDKTAKNDSKGSLRIRRIQAGHVTGGAKQTNSYPVQYVLNTKCDMGPGSRIEVPIPTTEDAFDLFTHLSESGMIKHRYHFPVGDQGLIFEVDMFIDQETGEYCPWAKIDLEVKDKGNDIPPFPFEVEECIKGDSTDEADQKKIRSLYDKYFITPNKFLNKPKDEESVKADSILTEMEARRTRAEDDPGDHEYRGDYHSDAAAIPADMPLPS